MDRTTLRVSVTSVRDRKDPTRSSTVPGAELGLGTSTVCCHAVRQMRFPAGTLVSGLGIHYGVRDTY